MSKQRHVVIVGAGLAGSLLARYLARDGWRVSVYERRPDPRRAGYGGGRSINLALSARGFSGLAGVGLDERVRKHDAIRMPGRMIHPVSGPLIFQPYSADPGDAINSVSRGGLNLTLLEAASEYPNASFHFECTCVDVEPDAPAAIIRAGAGTEHVACDLLIGADGAYSAVRARLQRAERFDYSQSYLDHGYKELYMPPAAGLGLDAARFGGYAMEPHALHIWPRGGAMMIALPNRDQSFTCTLFWPFRGEHGLEGLRTPPEIAAFFAEHYPDALPLMPTLARDYLGNPTGTLVTIRCAPWTHAGKVCLIGDAAHAIVPFYGQGMNAAFEDVRDLAALLKGRDQRGALEEFESLRKPSADAIADMAIENFVEMRDKVGDAGFRYRKRIEQVLHRLFPDRVTPQYNLVSFSTVPYQEARRRGRELEQMVDHVTSALPIGSLETNGEEAWERQVAKLGAILLAHPSGGAPTRRAHEAPIDITPPVTPRLAVWPGDTPMSREVLCDIEKGANITLSTIRATVHLGAHADGPNHYGGEEGIGERPLSDYLGPCQVVDAPVARGQRVRPQDLVGGVESIHAMCVLVRTGTFPDPERWNEDFAGLSVELIRALAGRGVTTVGIDTPSVDLFASKDLPAHKAVLDHRMAILEGLVLSGVEPGRYELIALPLRLVGFDASPVRAVLRRLDG